MRGQRRKNIFLCINLLPDPSLLQGILLYLRSDLNQKFLRVDALLGWLVRVMVRSAHIRQDMISVLLTPDSGSGGTSCPLLSTDIPVGAAGLVRPGLVELVGVLMG